MNFFKHMTVIFSAVLFSIVLASCSSGGSATSTNLEGTAATGKGIAGIVYITDANGTEINVPTSAEGSYTAQVAGMTPPFIVRVIPDDGSDTLYSFAIAVGQTANVTPLTNLALFLASGSTDLSAIYAGWDGTGLTQSAILDAQKKINANLEAQFVAAGLDAKSYDFLNTAFSTDGSGFDGILDLLTLSVDFNAGSFSVDISGTPFSFDINISITGFDFGTSTGGAASGSVTFSGAGAANIITGATFSPTIGVVTQGSHPVLPNTTFYTATWIIAGAGSGDGTTVNYTETISAGAASYSINVSSGEHQPVFNFSNYTAFNASAQITGVTVDKATGNITFSGVTLDGSSGTTGTITMDGDLTAN